MSHKRVRIGRVNVDAGLIWIGDPCYVMGEGAPAWARKWTGEGSFCNMLDDIALARRDDDPLANTYPIGNGAGGIAVNTAYGDGTYPVYAKMNDYGTILSVTVEFDEDGEDDDY